MDIGEVLFILYAVLFCLVQSDLHRLNKYISHYEGLTYNTHELHKYHTRAKRSTQKSTVFLKFNALGRSFSLRLRPDTSTFSSDFKLERSDGSLVPHAVSHIYEGELWGDPETYVHGSIINGTFAGKIYTSIDNYFVERSHKYFDTPQSFHSLIYAEKHVDTDPKSVRLKRSADAQHQHLGCGYSDEEIRSWMNSHTMSTLHSVEKRSPELQEEEFRESENIYTPFEYHNEYYESSPRGRRDLSDNTRKRTCTLFLQSDTMLWERMTGPKSSGGLGMTHERAREEITSLFAEHVNGLKNIYENTVFSKSDGSLPFKGLSFVVRRIKINETDVDCPDKELTPHNQFCRRNIDVSNFLNLNSLRNHDDFCLAYCFTYRDFIRGTLGLAWVGSATRASGGICERWKKYPEKSREVYKSLNTGIVTLINYNSPVPPKVSTLTFAHEVGHNFGSPHDDGPTCTPYTQNPPDQNGNYIMFASATTGDKSNNNQFSPCSKGNISDVLDTVINMKFGKTNCFVEQQKAFCGNNIVEAGEVCDCGYKEDCSDSCCYGRGESNQCQLRYNQTVQCSPSQGPCCNTDCQKVAKNTNTICRSAGMCHLESTCNGMTAVCPPIEAKPNGTICNRNTQICMSGVCQGSICERISWEQCYMTLPEDSKEDKGQLCYVACQNPSTTDATCISTGDKEALDKPENQPLKDLLIRQKLESIKLPPGAPCDNFQGYCDVFQKCRKVDADGPLARLKNLLFNEQTFSTIRDWIIRHWWAVLLMGVGLVVLMGIFIKVCAVHTPSSNPKRKPARKISLKPTRQQGPPPPYSGPNRGGPPHGKGRGPARQPQDIEMRQQKV